MSAKIKNLLTKLHYSRELKKLSKGFTGALFYKVAGAISSFALAVLIARYLGAEQAGIYYTALPIVMLCAFIARTGFDQIVMRETAAVFSQNGSYKRFHHVWGKIFKITTGMTLFVCSAIYFLTPLIADYLSQPALHWIIPQLIIAVVAIVVFNIAAQIIRGANHIWQSSFILFASSPLGSLICIIFFILFWNKKDFSPIQVVVLAYIIAVMISAILSAKWAQAVMKQIKNRCPTNHAPLIDNKTLLGSSLSFFVYGIGTRATPWVASLILAKFHEASQVAIFNSAVKVTMSVSFILTAVVAAVGPRFVTLYREEKYDKLIKLYKATLLATSLTAIPIVLVCYFFSDLIMGIFGDEFVQGGPVLIILVIGQFFSAVVGPQTQILIAIGREHILKNLTIMSFSLGTLLHLALVPQYGAVGSAIAMSTTVILLNIVTAITVSRFWVRIRKGA